jgi:hypothetical protein
MNKKQAHSKEHLNTLDNTTLPVVKPRERSKRLYNRHDDIYLPDISQVYGSKRGKSMFNL